MPQAVWTGDLSFGLVNIPVKLFTATSPKRVRFNQYEAGTGRRIRYRRVAESPPPLDEHAPPEEQQTELEPGKSGIPDVPELPDDAGDTREMVYDHGDEEVSEVSDVVSNDADEVRWEEIVRGFEIEPGRVVTVDTDELESVAPERSRVLEVEQFVDLESIDPIFFEKSYYVVPQRGPTTERPYRLLYRAMESTGKVAIGRFVMRTKEYLVAVRAGEHALVLETMFYADEVRDPKEAWVPAIEEPSERELQLAHQFIDALAGEWQPERHRDAHRERLLELLHSKAGDATELPEIEKEMPATPATDLMEILQASVDAARRARDQESKETG